MHVAHKPSPRIERCTQPDKYRFDGPQRFRERPHRQIREAALLTKLSDPVRLDTTRSHNILYLSRKRPEISPRRADPNDTLDLWSLVHAGDYASSGIP